MIGLIAAVLAVSLLFGVLIECLNASHAVRTEMYSALRLGRQSVTDARQALATSSTPRRDLNNLVGSFSGNRHLRVTLIGNHGSRITASPNREHSPFGPAASWFVRLVGVPSQQLVLPLNAAGRHYGDIVVATDPYNETLEAWNDFNDSIIVLAVFCVSIIVLIVLLMNRALGPLQRLTHAIEWVGPGDYTTHVEVDPAPELSRLGASFNVMVDRVTRRVGRRAAGAAELGPRVHRNSARLADNSSL